MDLTGVAGAAARRSARIGTALAIAGATAYGVNIVAARMTAQGGLTGPDMVVYRGLVFLPLVALIIALRRQSVLLRGAQQQEVLRFAVFAAGTALAYISSLKYLPVAMAVTIFYTYPLLVILLSPYVDGIRLSGRRWIVATIAFAGVMLAVGPHLDALDPRGVGLAFLGALCCAGMFMTGARLTTDGLVTFFWSQMITLPLALAFAWGTGGLATLADLSPVAIPLAITAIGFFLGLLLQILAAPRLSAASAGLLFLIEPVVSILVAGAVLDEHVTTMQAVGMLMVLGALVFDVLPLLGRKDAVPSHD